METVFIENERGYQIPLCIDGGGQNKIAIICHGFGSSQQSPTVEALRQRMPTLGIGTASFDFPAHGESPVDGLFLRVKHCMLDLAAVERFVVEQNPDCSICYFGSSFGAYITLLYLASLPHRGREAFLRSAAVDMYGIVRKWDQAEPAWIPSESGDPMEDYFFPDYDYSRPMKFSKGLLEDLRQNDVFAHYPQAGLRLGMIHGSADSTAPCADAKRFAALCGAELTLLEGGEHRLMAAGEMEKVLQSAGDFLTREGLL